MKIFYKFKLINKFFIFFIFLNLIIFYLWSSINFYNSISIYSVFLTCLFYPVLLALLLTFYCKNISNIWFLKWNVYISTFMLFILSVFFMVFCQFRWILYIKLYDFICFEDFYFSFDLYLNNITIWMFYIVFSVYYFVSLFSLWYMSGDPNLIKFLSLISYFSFFMLLLVISNNLVLVFVGWEGIGLFSYLLINFWGTRVNANRSALKAILINKIGDCFFYIFIFLFWFIYKTFNIYEPSALISTSKFDHYFFNFEYNHVMLIFVLIASMAKSAQIILHVWLPDAMEGPTPVSALLHAATMVTAGIFILLKLNFLVDFYEDFYKIVLLVGLLTNLLASLIAMFQYDIKKVIAYSTASQIGIVYMSYGIARLNLGFFHIFNHAYFKAFFFILAGILIHFFMNKQDLRRMFRSDIDIYFVYICFLISSFSLTSVPFFSGFYSKEFMIHASFSSQNLIGYAAYFAFNLSAITTFLYTFRIFYFLFKSRSSKMIYNSIIKYGVFNYINFTSVVVYLVCILLLFLSVFSGYLGYKFNHFWFITMSSDYYDFCLNNINKYLLDLKLEPSVFISLFVYFFSFIFILILHKFKFFNNYRLFKFLKNAACKNFYFNDIYYYLVNYKLKYNFLATPIIDKQFIEFFFKEFGFFIFNCVYNVSLINIKNRILLILYFFMIIQITFIFLFFYSFILTLVIAPLFYLFVIKFHMYSNRFII